MMAFHTIDDMNEFFDFDQLDTDHGSYPVHTPLDQHSASTNNFHDDMTIDWAADELALSLSHAQSLSNTNLQDAVSDFPIDDVAFEASFGALDTPYLDPIIATPLEDAASDRTRSTTACRPASTSTLKPASAKRKGPQSRISLEAKQILEDEFASNPYPCGWEMDIIAHQANLEVKKVKNWFNNTRARKKSDGKQHVGVLPVTHMLIPLDPKLPLHGVTDSVGQSLKLKLSRDSLEALDESLDKLEEDSQPPQPLAVYLAQSYQEEAVAYPNVQAALDGSSLSGDDAWSDFRQGRRGSIITSVASSEGTAPTAYTVSSNGSLSNISSFGRDRRRGRRRMAWKESPYNSRPKFNGVNDAGESQKDLPFFCTFCPRAFKTKYEWVRHEDSVHALRTTWICCDTKHTPLESCPFCGQGRPDDAHMATHKYHQCTSKPESQRTFYRRDHFVQHLHHVHFTGTKHPSVRVGCQARLLNEAGHNFGCKDLALKWRRFGAPMQRDDPMLHCGMCGKRSKDWADRSIHVAEHLIAREHDRSVWWPERKENHLENLYSNSPFESFRCRYCLKIFTDVSQMNAHTHCKVWSCRFLKSFDDVTADNAGPPLCPDFPSARAHHCHLCGAGYRTPHGEHAQAYHRYRSCNQEFYTSEEAFLQHLHNAHGASHPSLLRGHSVIEQSFMRNKGASFEPLEFNESWQPCLMDLGSTPVGHFAIDGPLSKKPSIARRKTKEVLSVPNTSTAKAQHRSDAVASRPESIGPRFFRLSTYLPSTAFRIFYTRDGKSPNLLRDDEAVLEEMAKPHVSAMAMSAGLVSMAVGRCAIKPQRHATSGTVELVIDDEGGYEKLPRGGLATSE